MDFELTGPGHTVGRSEAGLIVFVGDIQAIQLFFVCILPHAIVIEPKVHGGCIRCPQPKGELGGLRMGMANIDLGRVALPEIPDTEYEPAAGTAHIPRSGGTPAVGRCEPPMA